MLFSRRDFLGTLAGAGLLATASSSKAHAGGYADVEGDDPGCSEAMRPFEDEMLAHSRDFAPAMCARVGERGLRRHLRTTFARCASWGFTFRGPMRTVVELTFLFGTGFDSDPQVSWAGQILGSDGEQMARAQQLYEHTLDHRRAVTRWAERRAVARVLSGFTSLNDDANDAGSDAPGAVVRTLTQAFPEKAAWVGDEGMNALAVEAIAAAAAHRLTTRKGQRIMAGLFFAAGHGCAHDPLQPRIVAALARLKADAQVDVGGLETEARWWLAHALT